MPENNNVRDEIKRLQSAQADALKYQQNVYDNIVGALKSSTSYINSETLDMNVVKKYMAETQSMIKDSIMEISTDMETLEDNNVSLLETRQKIHSELLELHKKSNEEMTEEDKLQSELLQTSIEMLDIEIKKNEKIKEGEEALNGQVKEYQSAVDKLFGSLESKIDLLPNADRIKSMINFDDIRESTSQSVGGSIKDSFKQGEGSVARFKKASKGAFQGIGKVVGNLGKSLMKGMGPVGVILAVIDGIKKVFELAKKIDASMAETAKSLGITKEAAHGVNKEFNSLLITQETGRELMGAFRDTLGALPTDLKGTTREMYTLSKELSLSTDTAAKLASVSAMMGTNFSDVKEIAALNTIELQQGGYAGISLRDTLSDIAEVSGDTRALFGNNLNLLTKQVVEARKLGTTLDTLSSQRASLLDIESSLSSEIEARVLLGKEINLDKARQLALDGDLSGMGQELVNQVGSISEFNELSLLQKKAISAAIGTEVDELQTQLTKIDTINKLGEMSVEQAEKLLSTSEKELLAQKGVSKEQLNQYIQGQKTITLEEQQKEITEALTESLESNLPGMQNLIIYLSDLGNRISQVGLVRAVFGGGKSSADFVGKEEVQRSYVQSHDNIDLEGFTDYGGKHSRGTKPVAKKVAGDFISRPNQDVQYFSDKDIVLATKNEPIPLNSMLGSSPNMDAKLDKLITLLTHINNQLTKPAVINIGNKAIRELNTQLTATRNLNVGLK